jgi:cell division transport system permease protein
MSRLAYFARETLISLRRNLMMTLAGILTIAVSMSLLGSTLLLNRLVAHGITGIREEVEFDVYMNVGVTDGEVDSVAAQMEAAIADGLVAEYRYLDQEATYAEFLELFKDRPEVTEGITPDDLPTSFRAKLTDAQFASEAADLFEARPGVDQVLSPEKVAENIRRVSTWISRAFIIMVIVLAAAALFLIVNTIRLATYARRREIEVMKLVGASNWFVRVPFMAEGLVQGLLGAGAAFGIVYFLKGVLAGSVGKLSRGVFDTFFVTADDAFFAGGSVLVLGAAIGLVGSIVGLRRFLDV